MAAQRLPNEVPTPAGDGLRIAEATSSKPQPNGLQVIFVLEQASLELGKVGKTYQLLNSDEHANFLRRHKKDPADYRPDILHQELLAILDSPLNKAGHIERIYVHTKSNVLLSIHPQVRLPRTFKRFCGLMLQLLQKLSIRATNGSEKLLKVIKQPVTKYFPPNARRVGFSVSAPDVSDLRTWSENLDKDRAVVFVVGAMAHGKIDVSWTDELISISNYPLSGACCIGRICNALEHKLEIL
eukprot:scaffold281_cov318-Pavlova_lutheri.AAC.40